MKEIDFSFVPIISDAGEIIKIARGAIPSWVNAQIREDCISEFIAQYLHGDIPLELAKEAAKKIIRKMSFFDPSTRGYLRTPLDASAGDEEFASISDNIMAEELYSEETDAS